MFARLSAFSIRLVTVCLVAGLSLLVAGPAAAQTGTTGLETGSSASQASALPSYTYTTPVFGLAVAPSGSLLVADAGAGVVLLGKSKGELFAGLPGVTDMDPIGRGVMFAVTGGGDPEVGDDGHSWRLYRVSRGNTMEIANLLDFETEVNPDGGEIDSNPFDVERLTGGKALIADAGGNDLLVADMEGHVDWIATLPNQLAPTAHLKSLAGCPDAPPDLAFVCGLPAEIPAQPVATSVAIGPDGAYYVGELTGFPFPVGMSRVWRIEPGTRHAQCGTSTTACTVVASGFSAVIDLNFGPDGRLYVVELDEAGAGAVELVPFFGPGILAGGTVNACDPATWTCSEVGTDLTIPIAAAINRHGTVFVAVKALMPDAEVIALP